MQKCDVTEQEVSILSQKEIKGLKLWAADHLQGPPIRFQLEHAEIILAQFLETASYRRRAILAIAVMATHLHWVVDAPDDPDPRRMLADFKAYGSRALNNRFGAPASETWTKKGSKRHLHNELSLEAAIHYVL